jgi:hypothetical protein
VGRALLVVRFRVGVIVDRVRLVTTRDPDWARLRMTCRRRGSSTGLGVLENTKKPSAVKSRYQVLHVSFDNEHKSNKTPISGDTYVRIREFTPKSSYYPHSVLGSAKFGHIFCAFRTHILCISATYFVRSKSYGSHITCVSTATMPE